MNWGEPFYDPGAPLGIPNIRGTIVIWDSSDSPPTPDGIPNNHRISAYKTPLRKRKKLIINL